MKRIYLFIFTGLCLIPSACREDIYTNKYVSEKSAPGSFMLFKNGSKIQLCIHPEEYEGVNIALENLKNNLESLTGSVQPEISKELLTGKTMVIAGTIGISPWINELVNKGLIPANELTGKWEKYLISKFDSPFPGIQSALVIAGSDKRGTIFGIYDLAEKMGVSPWYYWADVPIQKHRKLYVHQGIHSAGEPKVKYRGIFINDEAPALAGWVGENFGAFNHDFYVKVFELILRMKGNYLWPAMWGRAFYDDDSLNAVMADTYGVVIGTSHHEPLMRAHDEWRRYGEGPWNYEKNPEKLSEFWRKGIQRMGENESIITVGMRGDGDEPMTEGTAISLLEKIVSDQREIIAEESGKEVTTLPQSWALYKEVQDYYDKGMRVPDDITLLLCDDNWGNIRKLPKKEDADRRGGFGIYYHFDYVGGPRNYKWLNTVQIERTWEQMHLAYRYGVDRIWIVNVGDIKPMELPIQFFLDYAWNPDRINAEDLPAYYQTWSKQQFGSEYAEDIAEILAKYTKFNARRKPEMLSPDTYSLDNYREAETVVNDYNSLKYKAEQIYAMLDEQYRDAYFQLVLYPVQACANLNELYYSAAINKKYAGQERAATNAAAKQVKVLFERDAELTRQYHEDLVGGKWNHMMSQTHIGYRYWQEPDHNNMPEVDSITVPENADMGVSLEEDPEPVGYDIGKLPVFDYYKNQSYHIEIFNTGQEPFKYQISSDKSWVDFSWSGREVTLGESISVSVNWKKLDKATDSAMIVISGTGKEKKVMVYADNTRYLDDIEGPVHLESNGTLSLEATSYATAVENGEIQWKIIPNLGRTGSAITAFPVDKQIPKPGGSSPHLEYPVFLKDTGKISLQLLFSPTLNFHNSDGRRIAVSFDDQPPQIQNIHKGNSAWMWQRWVGTNSITCFSEHEISKAGRHVLKYWLVDPGLDLQKIVIQRGPLKRSYLGPPESYYKD